MVIELTSIRASAVPAVPRTISASQRLAALERAEDIEEIAVILEEEGRKYMANIARKAVSLFRELAGDAKGER